MWRAEARTMPEVLLALAVLGLGVVSARPVVAAVLAWQPPAHGTRSQARIDLRTIHPVAEKYRVDHPDTCPTVTDLVTAKELSAASKTTDPWGTPYKVQCDADEVHLVSFGPDRKEATADDIRVPD